MLPHRRASLVTRLDITAGRVPYWLYTCLDIAAGGVSFCAGLLCDTVLIMLTHVALMPLSQVVAAVQVCYSLILSVESSNGLKREKKAHLMCHEMSLGQPAIWPVA